MLSDTSLIAFKAISNFTNSLSEIFGGNQRSLKLYSHLIKKTTLSHTTPIEKHVDAFRTFCVSNRDPIINKNADQVQGCITYSKRVFIDMEDILRTADSETTEVIWRHLLTISALVDPMSKARHILKSSPDSDRPETDFLRNIINKVDEHVNPNANPMEAVTSILGSGILEDLIKGMGSGVNNGSLDMSKLVGTVQSLVSGMETPGTNDAPNPDSNPNPMNMLNQVIGNMTAHAASNGNRSQQQMPDLSAIMGMMGPMLGALQNQTQHASPNEPSSTNPAISDNDA